MSLRAGGLASVVLLLVACGGGSQKQAGGVDPATPDQITEFRDTDHGRLVISEWRDNVPRKLGNILFRWGRLTCELSDEEFAEIDRYFRDGLQPHERAAVLRQLAA